MNKRRHKISTFVVIFYFLQYLLHIDYLVLASDMYRAGNVNIITQEEENNISIEFVSSYSVIDKDTESYLEIKQNSYGYFEMSEKNI